MPARPCTAMSAPMALCEKTGRNFFNKMEHYRLAVVQDLEGDGGDDEQVGSFTARVPTSHGNGGLDRGGEGTGRCAARSETATSALAQV